MLDVAKRVLVVAAHPDDLESMTGGAVARLTAAGADVWLLLCTSGDLGTHEPGMTRERLAEIREQESIEAARLLGMRGVFFLRHTDGELEPTAALRREIAGYYRMLQPDTLLTFDPHHRGQIHADHRAAGRAALDAFMPAKMPLYAPEQLAAGVKVSPLERVYLFFPEHPTLWIDIAGTLELKIAAMLAHKSQVGDGARVREWLTNMAKETAKGHEGLEYAEAFQEVGVW